MEFNHYIVQTTPSGYSFAIGGFVLESDAKGALPAVVIPGDGFEFSIQSAAEWQRRKEQLFFSQFAPAV